MHTSGMTQELQTLNILPVQKSSRLQCCQLSDIRQRETCLFCCVCASLSVSECAVPGSLAQPSTRSFSSVQFSTGQLGSKQRGSSTTDFRSVSPTLHIYQYCSQFHLTSLFCSQSQLICQYECSCGWLVLFQC